MATVAKATRTQSMALRLLLMAGVIGPLLFILVFLVEGAMRPDYIAWRHFVSSLSQGERGWVQITNFYLTGALVICFAVGLRQVLSLGKGATWGPILLGIYGLCLIAAGYFVTDPMLGYPPGASETLTQAGKLHMLVSLIVFIALPAACFVLSRRFAGDPAWRGWRAYSIVTGILVIVLFVATDVVAASGSPTAPVGLVQRLTIITGWTWVAHLAYRLLSQPAPNQRQGR